ncbi:MAG: hypothetical protein JWL77_7049, partial [Chthonomonadaceae bacterium]|nr:hypothetical protein [Chthonomonadaceae bacterium]
MQRGVPNEALARTDAAMQALLRLTSARSRRSQYLSLLTTSRDEARELEVQQELAISAAPAAGPATLSAVEARIVATLRALVPSAAVSYEQAVRDLADPGRLSYR